MSDQAPPTGDTVDTGVGDLAREAAVQVAGPATSGERPSFERRQGYITAIASDWLTCSIKFPESTDPIPGIRFMHKTMHPHVGDTVWVDQNGADTIVSSIGGLPVGAVTMYPNATPPAGWLACNGQSTNGYPALAAVCGPNVPDYRDRFPVGSGSSYAVGATGGEATTTVPPAHTHTVPEHGHTTVEHSHGQRVTAGFSGGTGVRLDYDSDFSGAQSFPQGVPTDLGGAAVTQNAPAFESQSKGTSGGVDNRPPYRGINFIIKHD